MRYILNYVNEADAQINYDKVFDDMEDVVIFVNVSHPKFTSYQVVVTR